MAQVRRFPSPKILEYLLVSHKNLVTPRPADEARDNRHNNPVKGYTPLNPRIAVRLTREKTCSHLSTIIKEK